MHPILQSLANPIVVRFTGNIRDDMVAFLNHHEFPKTARHCTRVGEQARRLAERFGVDAPAAATAGYLHDISAVFPSPQRAEIAHALGVATIPEEDAFPMIIHQKLSVVIAREIFGVSDAGVLGAIGCHTTLRAGASKLDQVVFVADKIKWDQSGEPPYLIEINAAVEKGLPDAAFCYLDYLWRNRASLAGPLHPWARAAWGELKVTATGQGK